MPLDVSLIVTALQAPGPAVEAHWPLLLAALQEFGIGSDMTQIAAAATIQVECPSWVPVRERLAKPERQPELYRRQMRYWPSGYFGRGFIQTTWFENYQKVGLALGIDLVGHPDLLLNPGYAARALAHYFATHGIPHCAEVDDWRGVRLRVNGGYTALDAFLGHVDALKAVLHG